MKIFLILLSLSQFAIAQVQVQIVDPEIDADPFEKAGYKVSKEAKTFSSLPNKVRRDKLLEQVPESKDWDELDKDIFYMDIKSKPVAELTKKYPAIKGSKFKELKAKHE